MKKGNNLYIGYICIIALIMISFPLVSLFKSHLHIPTPVNDGVTHIAIASTVDSDDGDMHSVTTLSQPHDNHADEPTSLYIEMVQGCGPYWAGICAGVYSTPSSTSTPVTYLRNGMTLKVDKKVTDAQGNTWYKIIFDEWLRYPERIYTDWYVEAKYAQEFQDVGMREMTRAQLRAATPIPKRIVVDKSDHKLYAYDGDQLFMETIVSTGTVINPTPVGEFKIFKKMPSRYMQGPLPGIPDDVYDLPGVPWGLYFTTDGAAIHGAYWHNKFGAQISHGCVNVPLIQARELYTWADLGTTVTVQE